MIEQSRYRKHNKILSRYIYLLSIIFTLTVFSSKLAAQNTRISLDLKNVTVKEALQQIEKKSKYYFLYNSELIDVQREVTINAKNQSIESILSQIFDNKDVDVIVKENHIVLTPTETKSSGTVQKLTITGKVTDEKGEILPGVSITIKGINKGVTSKIDGNYTISDVPENAVLVGSLVGMKSQEISVRGKTNINFVMAESVIGLNEVVSVGYGTQRKPNLTGAVSTVDSKQIEKRAATSVGTVLAGQVPGLTVLQKSGKPGDNFGTLLIRGLGTLGNNSPLMLVDNIEANINEVDINDIESVSILKDASSAAIYGVRAANGVIIVTTKKGKAGKPSIKYHGGYGNLVPIKLPERVDAYTYALMYNQARKNDGAADRYTTDDLDKWKNNSAPITHQNNDQYSELLKTGDPSRYFHNLSLSGGNDATKYFASIGFNYDGGLISTFSYKRLNYRLNLSQKVTEKLNVGMGLSGSFAKKKENSQAAGQIITEAYRSHPGAAIYYADKGLWATGTSWNSTRNMIAYVNGPIGYNNHSYNDYIASAFAEYELFNGLKLKAQIAYRNDNYKRDYFRNHFYWYQYDPGTQNYNKSELTSGGIQREFNSNWDITRTLTANYIRKFDKHNVNLLLGYEDRKITWDYASASRSGLRGANEITELDGVPNTSDDAGGNKTEYRLRSGFGRFNYNFSDRYLFEANLRYDGTSRFPKKSRFELFPSFSAGWRVSEEDFFNIPAINNLKIRASWGQLGNQEIGNYAFLPTYNAGWNYLWGSTINGSIVERSPLANTIIGWETTTIKNIGLDMSFFNNKLSVNAEYFIKNTGDILLQLPQPAILGSGAPVVNAGSVRNNGVEIAIKHQNQIGKDFSYHFDVNMGYVKNVITDLKGTDSPGRSVGDPIWNIYGYVAEGLFQNSAEIDAAPDQTFFGGKPVPGDVRYADINGRDAAGKLTGKPDGKVNSDDRKSLGSNFPKINFGIETGFNWKNFDLAMQWQGAAGLNVITTGPLVQPFASEARPLKSMVDNTWTTDNPDAELPRLTIAKAGRNYNTSTYWLKDGTFIKLRNFQIGYTIPKRLLSLLKIENIRFYVSGENLLQISKFKFDPEFAHGDPTAWDNSNYPSSRTYMAGVNITF